MRVSFDRILPVLGCGLVGFGFAIWLALFFTDPKRPEPTQERADRLAAENYSSFALSAPTPPFPRHWQQTNVVTAERRVPVAREGTALLIAACAGNSVLAGTLAFAFAAAALGALAQKMESSFFPKLLVIGLAMLGLAHAWAWQMADPSPFLIAGFSGLFLAAWLHERDKPAPAWRLGAAWAGLCLCAPVLSVVAGGAWLADRIIRLRRPARETNAMRARLVGAVLPLLVLAGLGYRNVETTGHLWTSPSEVYRNNTLTAPVWFWETVRTPPMKMDPVFERYDQLVALPAARWPIPVYQAWTARLTNGLRNAGGIILGIAALIALLFTPLFRARPALLLGTGISLLALLRYPFAYEWWALATPLLVWGILEGWCALAGNFSSRRLWTAGTALAVCQIIALAWAPQIKPSEAEYGLKSRLNEIKTHFQKKPGKHLVFVSVDDSSNAALDVADLPRNWADEAILFARDLAPEQNAELVAAMPERSPWRIIVFGNKIGLVEWKPKAPSSADNSGATGDNKK